MNANHNWIPQPGQKICHSQLGWVVTVIETSGGWVTAETGFGFQWTKHLSHIKRFYKKCSES